MSAPFDLEEHGFKHDLSRLIDATCQAGERALELYRQGAAERFVRKGDGSPVTEADKAVELLIRSFIARKFPHAAFVGEEEGETKAGADLRFVVDPIDGTRAFIRGLPTWSVLVGVEYKGEPVIGLALMPAAGDLFVASKGRGALCNGRPVFVSLVDKLADSMISHGALSQFADEGKLDVLPKLASKTYSQRGFADFDGYRQLLLGRVDAMIDPAITGWDMCAPAVLVREAGGRFTNFAGEETVWGGSGLASNGRMHDELLSLIAARWGSEHTSRGE